MYIVIAKDYKIIITDDEFAKIDQIIDDERYRFLKIKGQRVQKSFISGIYDLETYYEQEKIELSKQSKWRCLKCGIVNGIQDRCACNKTKFNFLQIKNNENKLLSS